MGDSPWLQAPRSYRGCACAHRTWGRQLLLCIAFASTLAIRADDGAEIVYDPSDPRFGRANFSYSRGRGFQLVRDDTFAQAGGGQRECHLGQSRRCS
jgi:hypothetical protein